MEYAGSWSTDLEHPPFEKMLVGINARAIDFAKFGMLMLKDGLWNAQQLVSEQWVREATQDEEKPAGYYRQDADFFADGHYYKYFWWGDRRSAGKVISMRRAIVDSTFTFHQKRKLLLSALDSITALRRGVGFDFFDSWLTICNTPNQLKPGSHMTTATSRIPPRLASGWGCRGPRLSSCSSLLV
jgi:hypothetical protein